MEKFYYRKNKNTLGPVDWSELQRLFESGTIHVSTKVAKQGDQTWTDFVKLREEMSADKPELPNETSQGMPELPCETSEGISEGKMSLKSKVFIAVSVFLFSTVIFRACDDTSNEQPNDSAEISQDSLSLDSIKIALQAEQLANQIVDSIKKQNAIKEASVASLVGYWDCEPSETADPYTIQMNLDGSYAVLMEENEIAGNWSYLDNENAFQLQDTEGFLNSVANIKTEHGGLVLVLQRGKAQWSFRKRIEDDRHLNNAYQEESSAETPESEENDLGQTD